MMTLRLAFLLPALADFYLAASAGLDALGVTDPSLLPRGQFVAVAACWGIFLLMGLLRPVERSWVLIPTALVIGGIAVAFWVAFVGGGIALARALLATALSVGLIILCIRGLQEAAQIRRSRD